MSKQANKTLIGVFVVAAVFMLVAAVLIFGSGKFFKEKSVYVAYFDGSVKGLRVGAPVVFRGVRIGEVQDIALHYYHQELEFKIPVVITLYPDKIIGMGIETRPNEEDKSWEKLLEDGLRATLEMQSIVTGQLLIGLDFHKDAPLTLQGLEALKLGPNVREIPTIKTGLQMLGKKIEQLPLDKIAADLQASLRGLNKFVNSPEFGKSLHYFKQTMREARNLMVNANKHIDPLFARVDQTLLDTQKLLRDVDGQVDPLATSIKSTSDDAGKLLKNVNGRIGPLQADLNKTTAKLRSALTSAESALNEIDTMVDDESDLRYYIDIFLREITLAARSIRALADYLERNPDALLRGKVSKANQKEGK
jgi:paraquat-inducible protein B